MVADLVIGAVIVFVLAAAASAAAMVIDAGQASRESARSAAVDLARGIGVNPAMRRAGNLTPPNSDIVHETIDGTVRVEVHTQVLLPHPLFMSKRVAITSRVSVPIAPYRSGR